MKIFIYVIIIFTSLLWVTNNSFASEEKPKLIINEVMPNPVGDDSKYEWIEIKNTSSESVNLNQWKFNGVALPDLEINSNEFILLTRDKSSFELSNKMVDFSFNLVNSGATLVLLETDTAIEHKFSYVQSIEGKSFELLTGDCSTIAINNHTHTMGHENTSCDVVQNPTITPFPTVIYFTTYNYRDLIISALSPYPSQGSEWVEISNTTGSEINLNGWIIKDESNKSFKIPELILNTYENTRIFPTTISLNNDGDTISLYDPQNKLIDSYKYGKVTKDQVVSVNDENQISEDEENIVDEKILIEVPDVRSINTESDNKSIYEILKKPIFYKVEDYIGI